jgi:NDP-mannose synthase
LTLATNVIDGVITSSLDYGALMAHHAGTGAALTIAVQSPARVDRPRRACARRRVTGFRKKPTLGYEVSRGAYAYEARALKHMPDGSCQFPDFVLRLLDAGEVGPPSAHRTTGST